MKTYLLGFEGGGREVDSTVSASRITSFFLRSFALDLGTLVALGFFIFGDCDFFVLKKNV